MKARNSVLWHTHFRMRGRDLVEECLFIENVVPNASAVLFRRSAVAFDLAPIKQFKFSGDWWFWFLLARKGDVAYRADAMNYHRRHDKSVVGQMLSSGQGFLSETIDFYRRLAIAAPECVTNAVARGILGRVDELFSRFSLLKPGVQTPAVSPGFASSYADLLRLLDDTKRPAIAATLIISTDVIKRDQRQAAQVIEALTSKFKARVLYLEESDSLASPHAAEEGACHQVQGTRTDGMFPTALPISTYMSRHLT